MKKFICKENLNENDVERNPDLIILKLKEHLFCLSKSELIKQVKTKPFFVIQTSEGTYDNESKRIPNYIVDAQNQSISKVLRLQDFSLDRSFISSLSTNQKIFELINPRKALLFLNENEKDIETVLYSTKAILPSMIFQMEILEKEFIEGKKQLWEQQNPLSKVCDREGLNMDISGKQISYDNELILIFLRNKNSRNKDDDKIIYCYTLIEMRSMLHKTVDFLNKNLTEIDGKILVYLLFWNIYVDALKLLELINSGINTIELIEHKSEKVTWYEPISSSRQVVLPKSNLESVFTPENNFSQTYYDVGEYRYRKFMDFYYDQSYNPTNKINEIKWFKYKINEPDKKVVSSYKDEPANIKYRDDEKNSIEEKKWMLDGTLHREPKNKDESDEKYPARINYISPISEENMFNEFVDHELGSHTERIEYEWFRNGIPYRKNINDPTSVVMISLNIKIKETFLIAQEGNDIIKKVIEYDLNDGKEKTIKYTKNGQLHSIDDKPAITVIYNENERILRWYKNGKLHRDGDKPAWITYFNSKPSFQEWYKNDKLHRDGDKPAWIRYYTQNGIVTEIPERQIWYQNGEEHREGDLPAVIDRSSNGKLQREEWRKNNNLHRDNDKPALSSYYYDTDNIKMFDEWYKNGYSHRENNGPTKVTYYKNGSVKIEEWYNRNEESPGPTEIIYYESKDPTIKILYKKTWFDNNQNRNRKDDLPAEIEYYQNGSIKEEKWFVDDNIFRLGDKPSVIIYDIAEIPETRGRVIKEKWTDLNGIPVRIKI